MTTSPNEEIEAWLTQAKQLIAASEDSLYENNYDGAMAYANLAGAINGLVNNLLFLRSDQRAIENTRTYQQAQNMAIAEIMPVVIGAVAQELLKMRSELEAWKKTDAEP